jgi:hypothetical protein
MSERAGDPLPDADSPDMMIVRVFVNACDALEVNAPKLTDEDVRRVAEALLSAYRAGVRGEAALFAAATDKS